LTEAKLTKKCKDYLENFTDIYLWKVSDRYTSGVPDLYFIINGRSFHIELKATGKRPGPLQRYIMYKINKAGGTAAWFDNYEDFIVFMDGHL
jgi:hypothetical protein